MSLKRQGSPNGKHGGSTERITPVSYKGKQKNPWIKRILFGVLGLFAACAVGIGVVCMVWLSDLPAFDADDFGPVSATEVYASDGKTVLATFTLQNRTPVNNLNDISPFVVKGTVATEDERFYEHGAIDLAGIARALVNNILGGEIEGASTITQQLVRNTVLADEAQDISIKRKLREAVLAVQVEQAYTKDAILLMYLNTINYGDGAYGIEAASQHYYSKSSKDLTAGEAAVLVGIPQSPTYNNPRYYYDHSLTRRNVVVSRMLSNGVIASDEAASIKSESIDLDITEFSDDGINLNVVYEGTDANGNYITDEKGDPININSAYFASYVRERLLTDVDENGSLAIGYDKVFAGGLKVYTTLDVQAQALAQKAAVEKLKEARGNYTKDTNIECAITVIDPSNGYVKAMIGGQDYSKNEYNLATQAGRQTGSSFKTMTLVTSIKQGIDPETMIDCTSYVKINDWEVHNYDFHDYGIIPISEAFALSSNTGFARLVTAVTPAEVRKTAQALGIKSDLSAVPSITLGSQDCNTMEMADAYATLANGGTQYDPVVITRVVDRKGNVIEDNSNPKGNANAVSAEVAHASVEVMKGVVTNGTGTAARPTYQEAAGKTGTTEDNMDSWFCGITPQYSVAIWLGDRSNMNGVYTTAASCFRTIIDGLVSKNNVKSFPYAKDPTYDKSKNYDPDMNIKGLESWSDNSNNNNNNNNANNANANNMNANANMNGEGQPGDPGNEATNENSAPGEGGGASGEGDNPGTGDEGNPDEGDGGKEPAAVSEGGN